MKIIAIIPAGGIGKRFDTELPKQFVTYKNEPIIIRTLRVFENIPEVEKIIIPLKADYNKLCMDLIQYFGIKKSIELVEGGQERQDSVANALEHPDAQNADFILVHDAVRPFATEDLIRRIIQSAIEFGASIPALQPTETIKQMDENNFVVQTFDRTKLATIQTPQGFKREIIMHAYQNAQQKMLKATDDAQLAEFAGYPVKVIEGEDSNIKITTKIDLSKDIG
ncbi:MAG: 2-C-methyl-D-erythritol 4-phosphate cytidylyltransferase [Bacteroidota bacterium]